MADILKDVKNMETSTSDNSAAGKLVAIIEKGHASMMDAFVNWAQFAIQMETSNGSSKVTARLEYEITNQLNGAYVALYGNTLDLTSIPEKDARIPSTLRFCARLNIAYWEDRYATYLRDHPEVDKKHDEYNDVAAQNDLNFINILVSKQEALLNYRRLMAQFNALKTVYEELTGVAYVYVPYRERDAATAPQYSKGNMNLAKTLLAG